MTIQAIQQAIEEFNTIIIHRHVRPDPDALGSQAGLRELIKASYPEKNVYVVGEDDPSLTFMVEMEQIDDQVYEDALVIICDTANTGRIDDSRYRLGKKVIKIDHHPNVDPYGDLSWVDTTASSTSEMIYEFYLHAKGLTLTTAAARLLYGGIVGDTGRFLYPSTTKKTLQYAADLVTYDFDRTKLYDGIYNVKDHIARMRGYILQNFTLDKDGLSVVKLTKDVLDKFHVSPLETGQLVGTLGEIEGIVTWVFFIEEEEQIRVRLRSKGPVINEVAAKYNGGGHPLASGASIYSWDEAENVVKDLQEVIKQFNQ
ncbi:bifunctional oligoribonuclease/PAP phosphatase NrnA [Ornithinibacillus sp. BX22]|uniref:Bifunctional oligoribonuclease/PAP phosphatase NrnA n=2 Tax=Ornithinibacillus TaxID=484508 RepID=A0A923L6Q2_9BACI|nr:MULTISPECIES: bifunctional oligoribonuclease/PAP phosphatase NrnA [Ornithinibacillus]MBC5637469.1 bifunctional oligoribonuclease/PAP phosphatase NrnA [Ornithinibacillus hominis]MBS3682038.1 bifunctional oligoribonuclease/PAP phosphatase NrnA [Ornithinibacillus massiliensis]